MSHGPNPVVVFGVVGGYLAFIGLIIFLAIRWSRRRTAARDEALVQGLVQSGARQVGTGPVGGYYAGTARQFEIGGQRVEARTHAVSRYHYRVNLGVATPPLPAITIIPEGMVDRLGKALGLNREVQTGDQAFDDAAYVDTSEEDAPVKQVLDSAAVRDGIREVLALGYKVQLSRRGLEAFQLVQHGTPPDVSRVGEVVALLGRIAAALPALDPATFHGRIPVLWARFLGFLLGWIPPLILAGLIDGVMHAPGARTMNSPHKVLVLGLSALTAWIAYVLLHALWLRGRSYAFRLLLLSTFFGLLGTPVFGISVCVALNQALDGSPAEERVATVIKTSKYKGDCRVAVASWLDPSREDRFPVGCKSLSRFQSGTELPLRAHAGALGMPWVEPVEAPR